MHVHVHVICMSKGLFIVTMFRSMCMGTVLPPPFTCGTPVASHRVNRARSAAAWAALRLRSACGDEGCPHLDAPIPLWGCAAQS